MRLKIYKGTNEIGGNCVELKTKSTTILLDYGTPLKEDSNRIKIDNVDAVLISHSHQDHFGEIVNIQSDIPEYCGELSLELMNITQIFTGKELLKNSFKKFKDKEIFPLYQNLHSLKNYNLLLQARTFTDLYFKKAVLLLFISYQQ